MEVNVLLRKFNEWAQTEANIRAVALVGSHAHNSAKPDSDIDLIIICEKPAVYLDSENWMNNFGRVKESEDEDYGLVQVKRVFYTNGSEVEFGFTTTEWSKADPIDPGTERVVKDGLKIICDKDNSLANLIAKI